MLNRHWLDILKTLAAVEPSDLPFLSVYLDIRPDGDARRECLKWLRDVIHKHGKTVAYHGDALSGYEADMEWIRDYLGDYRGGRYDPASHGLALFASGARGIQRAVELPVPFTNRFQVADAPLLAPLAETVARYPDYVVALVDVDTCRVLSVSLTEVTDRAQRQGDTADLSWTARGGGWSQKRFQRHIDHWRSRFADEAAELIALTVASKEAPYLVLAGEEWAVAEVRRHLPESALAIIVGQEHLDVDWSNEAHVVEATEPVVEAAAQRQASVLADRVLTAIAEGRPAVVGIGPTLLALEEGAVGEIVLPPALEAPGWRCDACGHAGEGVVPVQCPACGGNVRAVDLAEAVLRSALGQDAKLVYVESHEGLAAYGGMGALLRFAPVGR